MGHLIRAGWSSQANGREQHLAKGYKSFKVGFEGSSLRAVGSIDMISHCVSDVEGSKHDPMPVSGSSESVDINAIIAVPTSEASFVAVSQSVEAPI